MKKNSTNTQYVVENGSIRALSDQIFDLVVPEGVTVIPTDAFASLDKLFRVTLPSTLLSIEKDAFRASSHIVEVINHSALPIDLAPGHWGKWGGVTDNALHVTKDAQDAKAYVDEDGLVLYREKEELLVVCYLGNADTIRLPAGVTQICDEAFASVPCRAVELPDTLVRIGSKAFYCSTVREMVLPESVSTVDDRAFACSELVRLTIRNPQVSMGCEVIDHAYDVEDIYYDGTLAEWEALFDEERECQPYCACFALHAADGIKKYD